MTPAGAGRSQLQSVSALARLRPIGETGRSAFLVRLRGDEACECSRRAQEEALEAAAGSVVPEKTRLDQVFRTSWRVASSVCAGGGQVCQRVFRSRRKGWRRRRGREHLGRAMQSCASGKACLRSVVSAQDDFSRQRIVRKARHRCDLLARKPAQRVAKAKVMRSDVDGQIGHSCSLI